MDDLGPPHVETKLERALVFATVAIAMLGGWWTLNERGEKKNTARTR